VTRRLSVASKGTSHALNHRSRLVIEETGQHGIVGQMSDKLRCAGELFATSGAAGHRSRLAGRNLVSEVRPAMLFEFALIATIRESVSSARESYALRGVPPSSPGGHNEHSPS
jgi:hypothetical protein